MRAKRGVVGTSRYAAVKEARVVAEEMGCTVIYEYDVGVAGIHRLFPLFGEDGES